MFETCMQNIDMEESHKNKGNIFLWKIPFPFSLLVFFFPVVFTIHLGWLLGWLNLCWVGREARCGLAVFQA